SMDKQNAINFQLLGGIWILQTFPSVVFSLYTRWFHKWALLAGWAVGIVYGTYAAYKIVNPLTGKHFGGSLAEIPGLGDMGYVAMTAFVLNLVVTVVLSLALNAAKVANGSDETAPGDYFADAGDARVERNRPVLEAGTDQPAG
ncbi:MAG: sodium:solute symporter, partial [Marmoricola sp.]|nr:sodium:solute symporter [Marmoricola sp.]